MARVTGPFMSIDASGTIFQTLTASIWKGRNYIKGYTIPSNPDTDLQKAQRALMAAAVLGWQGLDDPTKANWNTFAATCQPPMSGFNAYVKAHIAEEDEPTIPTSPYIGKKGIR